MAAPEPPLNSSALRWRNQSDQRHGSGGLLHLILRRRRRLDRPTSPGMGVRINRLKLSRIYISITLRGGQRCMTEELLDGPEITPAGKQVGGGSIG